MQTSSDFLAQIETFLEKHDIAPSTFGKTLMGDPTFVFQLREGRSPSLETAEKINRIIQHPQASGIFGRRSKK